jgi:hypothetical protein
VVDVKDGETEAQFPAKLQENAKEANRVRASGNGYPDGIAGLQHPVAGNGLADGV